MPDRNITLCLIAIAFVLVMFLLLAALIGGRPA